MSKFDKYLGQKFNSLLITKVWKNTEDKQAMCECLCDCGNTHTTYLHHVRYGKIRTCGCERGNFKHGKHGTRIYRIWQAMKTRCLNPNVPNYKYYGGKGIRVCNEWVNDFTPFYEWAINNGYTDDLTIDRIDVTGNYEPSNCRWVTMKEQCNNHKSNIYQIELHGISYSLRDFVDIIGESYSKLGTRLYRGKCTIGDIEDEYNSQGLYINEYQYRAMGTCMPSSDNPLYMLFMLCEEVGELQSKFSKAIRKGWLRFDGNDIVFTSKITATEREEWCELRKKMSQPVLEAAQKRVSIAMDVHSLDFFKFENTIKNEVEREYLGSKNNDIRAYAYMSMLCYESQRRVDIDNAKLISKKLGGSVSEIESYKYMRELYENVGKCLGAYYIPHTDNINIAVKVLEKNINSMEM